MPSDKRNAIKWLPFNSVVNSKEIVNDLLYERNKSIKPTLSDEQKEFIEENLINAYYEHKKIKIDYFYNGNIYTCESIIKKIDFTFHKIYFNNKTLIFDQILKVF